MNNKSQLIWSLVLKRLLPVLLLNTLLAIGLFNYQLNNCGSIQHDAVDDQKLVVAEPFYEYRSNVSSSDIINFENFDNHANYSVNDSHPFIVPNIVHLIYIGETEMRFHNMICIFSIYLNHRPDLIIIHCDNCSFTGYYWFRIKSAGDLAKRIKLHRINSKLSIFNQQGKYGKWHKGDYWRIVLLMNFGGIYLDNDVYVVRSLDEFRKREMTCGWEKNITHVMGSQVLIAHKHARFLRAWFDSYRTGYKINEWYTNAGVVPGGILYRNPEIAHIEPEKFGVSVWTYRLYLSHWPEWREMYSWHLLINHRVYVDTDNYKTYKEFDEKNINLMNTTFSAMAKDVIGRMNLGEVQMRKVFRKKRRKTTRSAS